MTPPMPATVEMTRSGFWAVRSSSRGEERIMYGPTEEWCWKQAEATANHPDVEWVQVLPPREQWATWHPVPPVGWVDRLRERLFGWFGWLG